MPIYAHTHGLPGNPSSIYKYANTKNTPPDRCLYSSCWSSNKHFCTEPKSNTMKEPVQLRL